MGQAILTAENLGDRLLTILLKLLLQFAQGVKLRVGKTSPQQPVLVMVLSMDGQRGHLLRMLIQVGPGESHVTLSQYRMVGRHLCIGLDEQQGPGNFLGALIAAVS